MPKFRGCLTFHLPSDLALTHFHASASLALSHPLTVETFSKRRHFITTSSPYTSSPGFALDRCLSLVFDRLLQYGCVCAAMLLEDFAIL
ncbi:hypothetical protein K461DRAFT_273479 [Myriangium duriaei CBS 260.36]|uniref:Uncharacterized protein n=1 Tax=Myriangium duriaei CBS 260.36 TaxID=1168546 RepID=A0A9P4JC13_9PEZI|nr:hypothetical protein K461DRAFT_273479 [Myriangium duriaei CBS 260.36]